MAVKEVIRKRKIGYNVEQLITDRVREAQDQERYYDIVTSRYICRYLQITVLWLLQYFCRRWGRTELQEIASFDVAMRKKLISFGNGG